MGCLFRVQLEPRMHSQSNVLADGEVVKQVIFLKQHRYRTTRGRRVGMRLAVDVDTAAGRRQKTGNQVQQRAFPGAAGAKHRDAFSAFDGKRKTHRQMLVKPGHIIQF